MESDPLAVCEERFKQVFQHIAQGEQWRVAILGIIFAIILQVVAFATLWGELTTKVKYIEKGLDMTASKLDRHIEVIVK